MKFFNILILGLLLFVVQVFSVQLKSAYDDPQPPNDPGCEETGCNETPCAKKFFGNGKNCPQNEQQMTPDSLAEYDSRELIYE